jgi:hypothetical protein
MTQLWGSPEHLHEIILSFIPKAVINAICADATFPAMFPQYLGSSFNPVVALASNQEQPLVLAIRVSKVPERTFQKCPHENRRRPSTKYEYLCHRKTQILPHRYAPSESDDPHQVYDGEWKSCESRAGSPVSSARVVLVQTLRPCLIFTLGTGAAVAIIRE